MSIQTESIIEQLVLAHFTDQNTQKLLIDEYIKQYMIVIFTSCDYGSKEVLSSIIKTCAPVLQNLQLFNSADEASEYVSALYEKILDKLPQLGQSKKTQSISIASKITEALQHQKKSIELQKQRDLYQQTLNYQAKQMEERALTTSAKRILKGKSTLEKETGIEIVAQRQDKNDDGANTLQSQATISQAVGKSGVTGNGIVLQSASIAFGSNVLLDDVDFTFTFGHRYCLVARNGMGKSSLLKAIYDDDLHCIPNREKLNIAFVRQEVPSGADSALDLVLAQDSTYTKFNDLFKQIEIAQTTYEVSTKLEHEVRVLLADQMQNSEDNTIGEMELLQAQYKLAQQMEDYGCNAIEERARILLSGLGFTAAQMRRPTAQLSGGWRSRAALACALFTDPDILLLDEPTNNLDLEAVLWLEKWLRGFGVKKLLIVVSHDIQFIDEVATDVVLLRDKKLKLYAGCGYTKFAETLQNEQQNLEKALERSEKKKEHMQQFINRFRANAKRASLVQSRIKEMQKIHSVQLSAEVPAAFSLPQPYEPGKEREAFNMVEMLNVDFAHTNSQGKASLGGFRIKNCNILVKSDSRIAIVGSNAAGKSTMLKLITGTLKPITGEIIRAPEAIITAFWQHHQDQLNLNISSIEQLSGLVVEGSQTKKEVNDKVRSHLARFGITAELAQRPIRTLSGGQRTRVTLAVLTFGVTPSVLILDEPTNHLDIETKDALIEALQAYNGALIIVSHDGPFIEQVTDELYVMKAGVLTKYNGPFERYRDDVRQSLK